MSLADKCIVVGCFVCWDYDKILMETGKFSDNIRVTKNWSPMVNAWFELQIINKLNVNYSERVLL